MRFWRQSVLQALEMKIKAARGSSRLGFKGVVRPVVSEKMTEQGRQGAELTAEQMKSASVP